MLKNNKYSIRKTKIAVGSVLIATTLIGGPMLSKDNIIAHAETILVPRSENIYDGVTIEYSDGYLYLRLPDNVEYREGDSFDIYSSLKLPIHHEGSVNITNEDNGQIIRVGEIQNYSEANPEPEFHKEERALLDNIGFEEYSKGKMVESLTKFERDFQTETRAAKIVLNNNINSVTRNRVLKVKIGTYISRGIYRPVYFLRNPFAKEVLYKGPSIYGRHSNETLTNKIKEFEGKKFNQTLSINGKTFFTSPIEITPSHWTKNYVPKGDEKVNLGIFSNSTSALINRGVRNFDPNEDIISAFSDYTLNHHIYPVDNLPNLATNVFYNEDVTIAPGEFTIKYSLIESPLEFKKDLTEDYSITFVGKTGGITERITDSTNKEIFKIEKEENQEDWMRDIKFRLERISDSEVFLTNKDTIFLPKELNLKTFYISDDKLFNLAEAAFRLDPRKLKLKKNWQNLVNYENKTVKNRFIQEFHIKEHSKIFNYNKDEPIVIPSLGWGANTRGTVVVKYEDEDGNQLKLSKTLMSNEIWSTKYFIDPNNEIIPNYIYKNVKTDSKPLAGIVGAGERVVTLVYESNVRYIADPNIDYGEKVPNVDGSEVRVGTKPKVTKVLFERRIVHDPTKPLTYREVTTPGVEGEDTTTYTVDPTTGDVTRKVTRTKRTVDEVVTIGTGANKPVEPPTVYQADPNSPVGTREEVPGTPGTADVTGKILEQPTPTIVKLGTKTVIERVPIPFGTDKQNNDKVPVGKESELKAGQDGERVITKTYTVNPQTGEVTEYIDTQETPPVNKVVEVGTGENVVVPSLNIYEANNDGDFNTREVIPGKPGLADVTGKILEEPTPTIIKVGTKTIIERVPIPFGTNKQNNNKVPVGKENELREGQDGERIITKTYTVDPNTGKVTEHIDTQETPAINKIVEVGTGENVVVPSPNIYEANNDGVLNTREVIPGKPGLADVTGKILEEPTPTIIKVGTKTVIEKEVIPFNIDKQNNDKSPIGKETELKEGKNGERIITKTYTVNPETGEITEKIDIEEIPAINKIVEVGTGENIIIPSPNVYEANNDGDFNTREVVPGKPGLADITGKVLEEPTPTIIKVGTKTIIEKEVIPFNTDKQNNNKVPVGKETELSEGKNGERIITKTYTVNPETGEITENIDIEEVPAINKIVEVGTGENIIIPSPNIYEANNDGDFNIREVIPGKPGLSDVTGKILEEPTPTIIKVGTKTVIEREVIPFNTDRQNNNKIPVGTEEEINEGKNGERIITKTYTVNPETGEITEHIDIQEIPAINKIIEVGTGGNIATPSEEIIYIADSEINSGDRIEVVGKPKITDVTGKILEEATPTIIKVGTKTIVEREVIPFNIDKQNNNKVPVGKEAELSEGKNGERIITKTYTVNPKTGELIEHIDVKETPAINKIVEVGTGENIIIPSPKVYEADYSISPDEKDIIIPGKTGLADITGKVLIEPVPTIIKKGAKTKIITEELLSTTTFVGNEKLTPGLKATKQKGKNGTKTITVNYSINPETGELIELDTIEEIIDYPIDEIIEVGTLPQSSSIVLPRRTRVINSNELGTNEVKTKEKGKDGKGTKIVTYEVNPKTGELTEKVEIIVIEDPIPETIEVGTNPNIRNLISGDNKKSKTEGNSKQQDNNKSSNSVNGSNSSQSSEKEQSDNKELPKTGYQSSYDSLITSGGLLFLSQSLRTRLGRKKNK